MSSKKKTYWKGFAEKHQTQEFAESSEKEFHSELPIDQFVGEEGLEKLETGRRDFLKFMGFSVAAATLASCEAPVIKSIPYLNICIIINYCINNNFYNITLMNQLS